MIEVASRMNTVEEYYFSRKLKEIRQLQYSGKDIINLGIGNPDLPPPIEVVDEIKAQVDLPSVHGYQSYKGHTDLREGMAKFYQRWFDVNLDSESEILPLMGSKEGLMHVAMTFLEKGDVALVPNPGYPTYSAVTKLAGAKVQPYVLTSENDYMPDIESLAQLDLEPVKLMFLNYPHMPTGRRMDLNVMKDLIDFAIIHNILLVHDNPYAFILNDAPKSILEIPGAKQCCIELNSLSKSFRMAGWRLGMMVGNARVISEVLRFKSNMDSGMFLPIQKAAIKALELDKEWFAENNRIYQCRKELVYNIYDHLGVVYDRNQAGMFVWGKVPEIYSSGYEMSDDILYNNDVFMTPGGIFGSAGDRYIRTSLCVDEYTLEVAMSRLKSKR